MNQITMSNKTPVKTLSDLLKKIVKIQNSFFLKTCGEMVTFWL